MTTFNHGDLVVSTTQKDITLEAQVDFETPEGKVYISEWGKNLNNPMRIVLDKKYLVKKDKKVKLTKSEFQKLIYEYYPNPVAVDDLDKEVSVHEGFVTDIDRRRVEYVRPYLNGKHLFREYDTGMPRDTDDRYFCVSDDELQQGIIKKDDVLDYIFGTHDESLYEIDLDSNENADEENV